MLITPALARSTLADLIQNSALPFIPDVLLKTKWIRHHGHILIGDKALRAYKVKAQWRYDDRDIRRAGHELAAIDTDPEDLVEILVLDRTRRLDYSQPPDPITWREVIANRIHHAAYIRALRTDDSLGIDIIGDNGLPGGIPIDDVITHYATTSVGGLQPLRALTRHGTSWYLPRACADLLDRWQALELTLSDQARICSACKSQGPRYGGWRQPTSTGFDTLCPTCSATTYPPYEGQLRGTAYNDLRRALRADHYLCRLCQTSRAFSWDHCHDHGLIRGPICASCNVFEGKGISFLKGEGSVQHLQECLGCRNQQTLPRRYRLDVATEHLQKTQRHGRCRSGSRVHDIDFHHGTHTFNLYCPTHGTRWTTQLTTAEVADIVRDFLKMACPSKTNRLTARYPSSDDEPMTDLLPAPSRIAEALGQRDRIRGPNWLG
ncbi:endonuclease domain-containing protein [Streptomyces sp. NPDC001553]|uniref:endonuclease domain-containing protein n=1 Tax=Streptomyces sp. NPDC001553 TaxID=3154385 RepID=UPI00332F8ABF